MAGQDMAGQDMAGSARFGWTSGRGVPRGHDLRLPALVTRRVRMTEVVPQPDRPTEPISSYEHDGLVFDVVDAGPADGPIVLLLHGFPQRASSWRDVAAFLAEAGYRTLALDQRGYSPGARPRTRLSYTSDKLVGDVLALIECVGTPVHLVGHDWGAVVAWRLAAAHPTLVLSLTAVSVPHPSALAASLLTSSQALRSWYVLAVQPPALPELVARLAPEALEALLRGSGMTEDELTSFRAEILADGALSGALGWYRGAALDWHRTEHVTVPTTFVWSDGEQAIARRGAELTAQFVNGPYDFVVLEGATHWIPTQAPRELAAIIGDRVGS